MPTVRFVFIMHKKVPDDAGSETVLRELEQALKDLGLDKDYVIKGLSIVEKK